MLLGPTIRRYIGLVLQRVWLAQSMSIFGGAHLSDKTLAHQNYALQNLPSPPPRCPSLFSLARTHTATVPEHISPRAARSLLTLATHQPPPPRPTTPKPLFGVRVAVVTDAQTRGRRVIGWHNIFTGIPAINNFQHIIQNTHKKRSKKHQRPLNLVEGVI